MTEEKKVAHAIIGKVVSNKMDKTITVLIERKIAHPLYKKFIRRSTKIHAHDGENTCNEGDKVMVEQCRPMSKSKAWRLVEVLERSV